MRMFKALLPYYGGKRKLLSEKELLNVQAIEQTIRSGRDIVSITDVTVDEPDLAAYDGLLAGMRQGVLS